MGSEFGIVQFFQSIFHVFVLDILANSSSIFVDIGKTHITGLSHVIFQVLPTTRGR